MTVHYSDDWLTVLHGDVRDELRTLPDESVHCVITSPPYWGLRDYGTATWEGGDSACDHQPPLRPRSERPNPSGAGIGKGDYPGQAPKYTTVCGKCGAVRLDNQLGLEPTPEQYVENMVAVFREVRRVLRSDGTLWLNLGDSYASGTVGRNDDDSLPRPKGGHRIGTASPGRQGSRPRPLGTKPKDLVGIPWRVAFALQADGWYLRSEIIWSKPNPMPESVTDRPTKSHEQLFLLTKSARYFYDSDAVREGLSGLSADASGSAVLPAAESERPVVAVSGMQRASGHGVAQASWLDGQDPSGQSSLRGNGTGARGQEGERPITAEASSDGNLSAESGRPGGQPSLGGVPKGSGPVGAVLPRATDGDGGTVEPNGGRVGADQGGAEPPLSVLRPADDVDDGSRDPGQQGRDAHAGERGGGVQAMQQPEARSAHMAGTPRNDGDRWREVYGGVAARGGRNLRSVWTIATAPYPGAHFATFPPKLVEPCIKAGTSEKGVCPECGRGWRRVTETEGPMTTEKRKALDYSEKLGAGGALVRQNLDYAGGHGDNMRTVRTLSWIPSCAHDREPVGATVLDPFAGSGTTGMVAQSLSRRAVLIDLNVDYLGQLMERNRDIPLGLEAS